MMRSRTLRSVGAAWLVALLAACGGAEEEGAAVAALAAAAAVEEEAAAAPEPEAPAAPASARDAAPPILRGLYVNAYAAGTRSRLVELMDLADATEINAFVVDVKDEKGIRHRGTQVALAAELAQDGAVTIRDLKALTDTLRGRGIYTIARVVVFKDPVLAAARPDWSVRNPSGGRWIDRAGNGWVSPWDERVWDYNISIAEEAARLGFHEIQFDYVRFAEQYRSLPQQVHPRARGDRTDAIVAFLTEARRRLEPLGVTVTADVFGLSPNEARDVGIGQQWERISAVTDHVLPMMYPSHYLPTHLPGVPKPDLMPYEVLFKSAGMARLRTDRLAEAGVRPARVIPWLQAFNAPWLGANHQKYGGEQLRQQKQGVYDVGFEDWILWHPGSRYAPVLDGLERGPAQPRAKREYTPPADVLRLVEQFERQGVADARARLAGGGEE
jgi:hypothetical protein